MICALMIGRAGSKGFPNKNIFPVLGRPVCEYPILAAIKSKYIDTIFVSTDCPEITKIAKKHKCEMIFRPDYLNTDEALGEDVFHHGYLEIKNFFKAKQLKYIVLLFANSPTINCSLIDEGIKILDNNKYFDSAVTTSIYNMWSPLRARKLSSDGSLKPFIDFEYFGDPKSLNCDRDSQGDVYFADMSVSIIRPYCLENMKDGLLPQKWMGNNIAPINSWGGCDVDYEWQIPQVEFWLKKNNY